MIKLSSQYYQICLVPFFLLISSYFNHTKDNNFIFVCFFCVFFFFYSKFLLKIFYFYFFFRKVYFADAQLDIIVSMNYDGSMQETVHRGNIMKHPFGLSVFEDYIFFSDWTSGSIRRASKVDSGLKFFYKTPLMKPMALQVVHPARQPISESFLNHCLSHRCSHLCVLKPSGYSCKCPYGLELTADGYTCNGKKIIYIVI